MKWGYLLMFKINNLANQTSHIVTEQKGIFSIVEHNVDFSVAPCNAMEEYYMSQMNVKRKQAIANLLKEKKTVVMIAHTLSIVKNADQILVVADGTIKESGTHEELLARGGFYANLYASQFAKA